MIMLSMQGSLEVYQDCTHYVNPLMKVVSQ